MNPALHQGNSLKDFTNFSIGINVKTKLCYLDSRFSGNDIYKEARSELRETLFD